MYPFSKASPEFISFYYWVELKKSELRTFRTLKNHPIFAGPNKQAKERPKFYYFFKKICFKKIPSIVARTLLL